MNISTRRFLVRAFRKFERGLVWVGLPVTVWCIGVLLVWWGLR